MTRFHGNNNDVKSQASERTETNNYNNNKPSRLPWNHVANTYPCQILGRLSKMVTVIIGCGVCVCVSDGGGCCLQGLSSRVCFRVECAVRPDMVVTQRYER